MNAESILAESVAEMRRKAVRELVDCGYSVANIERMEAGIGPFPESRISLERLEQDDEDKRDSKAFCLLHVLWHLKDFKTAWGKGEWAQGALCLDAAHTERFNHAYATKAAPGFAKKFIVAGENEAIDRELCTMGQGMKAEDYWREYEQRMKVRPELPRRGRSAIMARVAQNPWSRIQSKG